MPSSTKSKVKLIGHQWSFASIWNEALSTLPQRPLIKREHIWASELGGSKVDRYLKMMAHAPSNPPNERSHRKFAAGHIWEWVIGFVLTSAGILKAKQLRGEVELPGLLKVSGKLDFIAGGEVDWEKAKADIKQMQQLFAVSVGDMPPVIFHAADLIITRMQKTLGKNPLQESILEVKSVSSFMSDKIQKTGKAMPHHVLQNLHYCIANNLPGLLSYICKDDCIVTEHPVVKTKSLLKIYQQDVEEMTGIIRSAGKNYLKTIPPKEQEVKFDFEMFRFEKNFYVEYSNYLTFLYGYETPEQYRMKWQRMVSSWNRTFKRCVNGSNMTDLNKKTIGEAKKYFADWDVYVSKAKAAGAFQINDEEEE